MIIYANPTSKHQLIRIKLEKTYGRGNYRITKNGEIHVKKDSPEHGKTWTYLDHVEEWNKHNNPTTKARKRAASKGGASMAKRHRSAAQKAATARMLAANRSRKRHRNPSSRKATHRRRYAAAAPARRRGRRVHRNPSFGRGILGELASMNGVLLLGSAAIAPTAVDMIAEKIVPTQYASGWTGLLAKAAIAAAGVWAIDRFGKQRYAAIGFAAGSLGSLLALGYRTFQAQQALPAAVTQTSPATADEIAKNPTLYQGLMNQNPYQTLNGYEVAPMGGYSVAPMGLEFESLN